MLNNTSFCAELHDVSVFDIIYLQESEIFEKRTRQYIIGNTLVSL